MKKTSAFILSAALIFTTAFPCVAFADTATTATTTETAVTTSAESAVALTPMSISLEQALELLKDSPQMELVEIQYTADKAVATGASEGLRNLEEANDAIKFLMNSGMPGADIQARQIEAQIAGYSKQDLTTTRNFARKMLEANNTARNNDLRLQAIELYYTVKNTEALCAIAEENCNISQSIYESTAKKYSLGVASKVDLLSAELERDKTKDSLLQAQNGLEQVKMGFNIFFGLDLMQSITLTDEIATPTLPAMTLDESIKSALANRNEIKKAEYDFELAERNFGSKQAYPSNSATYLGAKVQYLVAQTTKDMQPVLIEQDVRTKYMTMMQQSEALKTSEKSVANAKESLRLVQLQYNSGLVTLTILQQTQLGYAAALQSHADATLKYALAVEEYNLCSGVGTKAAALQ